MLFYHLIDMVKDKMNYIIEYLCSKLIDTSKMFGEVSDNKDSKTVNEVGINNLIESKKLELFSKNFYEIKKKFILMIIGLNEKISMEEKRILMFFRKELYDNNENRKKLLKELIIQKQDNLRRIMDLEKVLNRMQKEFANYNERIDKYNESNSNYQKEKKEIYKERYRKVKIIYEVIFHKKINFEIDALLKDEQKLIKIFVNLETEVDLYLKDNINDIKNNLNELLKIRITKDNAIEIREKVVFYNEIINYSSILKFKEDEKKEFYLYKYILNCCLQCNKLPISDEEFKLIKDMLYKKIECLEEKLNDNLSKFDYKLRRNIKIYLNEKKNMIKNSDTLSYDILSLELLECLCNIDNIEYINSYVNESLKTFDCYYKNPNEVKNIVIDFGSNDINLGIYMGLTNLFSSIKMCNDYIKINSKDIDECDMYACPIYKAQNKIPEYKPIKARFSNIRKNLRSGTIPSIYKHYLETVEIPDSITSLGGWVFSDCTSLIKINLPKGVTSIGKCAFSLCSSLKSINLPDSITSLSDLAFSDCTSLTSINLPEGVTSIGALAFNNCTSLTSINLPEGVTSIGYWAFRSCTSLTSINLPEGVTSIGIWAFRSCTSLKKIYCTKKQKELLKNSSLCFENVQIVIKDNNKDLLKEHSKQKVLKKEK